MYPELDAIMSILSPKLHCGGLSLLQPSTVHEASLCVREYVQREEKREGGRCLPAEIILFNQPMVLNTNGCIKKRKECMMSVQLIPFIVFFFLPAPVRSSVTQIRCYVIF